MSDVVMPRLSDTMEEGTILRWLKRDGDRVARGEELVEIETDKASMTYESDRDGTLETVAAEGDTLPVGELIARIGAAEPSAVTPAEPSVESSGDGAAHVSAGEGRVKASPLARRLARERGVDLRSLAGSGPGGRIVKADVEAAGSTTVAPAKRVSVPSSDVSRAPAEIPNGPADRPVAPAERPVAPAEIPNGPAGQSQGAKGETTTVELSRTQRTIARRMAESKATIPDFTLTIEVDMERCVELRSELKRLSHDETPTYNDMIVKACALALREHPRANASYRDGRFELHSRVNVGVAVAVAGDRGTTGGALVVPTVFDADAKALGEIARETRALAQRVRDGTVTPPELSGATFTVSNLGMYSIARFTAIINPPQAAILAVGAVERRAVVATDEHTVALQDETATVSLDERDGAPRSAASEAGQLVARHAMSLTLSCDHRILYGADAALFLARVRELLEEPAALTL